MVKFKGFLDTGAPFPKMNISSANMPPTFFFFDAKENYKDPLEQLRPQGTI